MYDSHFDCVNALNENVFDFLKIDEIVLSALEMVSIFSLSLSHSMPKTTYRTNICTNVYSESGVGSTHKVDETHIHASVCRGIEIIKTRIQSQFVQHRVLFV